MARKNAFAGMAADIAAYNAKNEANATSSVNEYEQLFRTKDYSIFEPYPNEELRLPLHTGQKYEDLKKSLLDHGMTTPIKVIKAKDSDFKGVDGDKLIVLGGHNRLEIAKENNLDVVYNILKPMTVEECDLIMSEEVILNRQMDELSPMQIVHILVPMYKGSNIREVEAKLKDSSNALSYVQISRYLKLLDLIPEFQTWVDERQVTVMDAQILCKISNDNQKLVYDYLVNNHLTRLNKKQIESLILTNDWTKESFDEIFIVKKRRATKNTMSAKRLKTDLKPVNNLLKTDFEMTAEDMEEYKAIIASLEELVGKYV